MITCENSRSEDKGDLLKRLSKNKATAPVFRNSQTYQRFTSEAAESCSTSTRRKTLQSISGPSAAVERSAEDRPENGKTRKNSALARRRQSLTESRPGLASTAPTTKSLR